MARARRVTVAEEEDAVSDHGQRLRLVKLDPEADAGFVADVFTHPVMRRHRAAAPPLSVEQAADKIRERDDSLELGIELCDDAGTLIGITGLTEIDWLNGTAISGTHILPAHQGNGYAPRAKTLLLAVAFKALNLRGIESRVSASNTASLRQNARAGYVEAGRLHAWRLHGGDARDEVVMYITRTMWLERHAGGTSSAIVEQEAKTP